MMTLAIWQTTLLVVLVLSSISLAMQVYGQRVLVRDQNKTDMLIQQNEQLSEQIQRLQKEIEQLTTEMTRIMEENIQLNKEVTLLNQDVNRLQERFGCSVNCRFKIN